VTQETTGQDGDAANLLEQRIELAEATCELIAANVESPGGPTHQQILEAWHRWRDVAAPVSEWRPEPPVAPVGERGKELLQRLELAERVILSLQFTWTADYQKEYERDWQTLILAVADWQAAPAKTRPLLQ
jgi:hypothetical protein